MESTCQDVGIFSLITVFNRGTTLSQLDSSGNSPSNFQARAEATAPILKTRVKAKAEISD